MSTGEGDPFAEALKECADVIAAATGLNGEAPETVGAQAYTAADRMLVLLTMQSLQGNPRQREGGEG